MIRPSIVASLAAELGCRVFPVRPDSKRPAITDPFGQATDDPLQIREWWGGRFRGALIGVPLIGLACLDFDPVSLQGARVREPDQHPLPPLEAFFAEFGPHGFPLDGCYREMTPRGGAHVVCRASPGVDRQWNGWRPGVDLKAGRSFIIIAPSPGYEFVGGVHSLRPDDLQPLPSHVVAAMCDRPCSGSPTPPPVSWQELAAATRHYRPHPIIARALLEDCRRLAGAPLGYQERELNRLGYVWGRKVRRGSVGAERVLRALTNAAMRMVNYRPAEPWLRPEIEAKLRDAILEGYAAHS